ncbi:ferritin-like protein [Kitasatospora sp. NPDC059812]|uniref:ferritin-like domain-containing protein n=1 Tax=Kitasatospora sp. NPDC059812 TaxID=3346958 RepID=UPI00365B9A33
MTTDATKPATRRLPDIPFAVTPIGTIKADRPIEDIDTLLDHLYQAAQVELSTVPMYLYAAYSIGTKGHSQWDPGISAQRTIISIAIEEMLHLCLVRNLIIALGGADRIVFYDPDFITRYPSLMLHRTPPLTLHLEPCSKDLMNRVFLPLELPAEKGAKPQPGEYNTLGQFYKAIEVGLKHLTEADPDDVWKYAKANASWQYESAYWNHDGGGEPVVITDLHTAETALKMVVEQGEGVDPKKATVPIDPVNPRPGLDELSHYAKFKRIEQGIEVTGQVRNVPSDPRAKGFSGPAAGLAVLFNAAYCYTLAMLDKLYDVQSNFNPNQRNTRYHLERTFIASMSGVLYPIAELLMTTPGSDDPAWDGTCAAPTFEYYDFAAEQKAKGHRTMKEHLLWLCETAVVDFPELGGDNSVHWLLKNLPSVDDIPSDPPASRPRPMPN